MTEDEAWVIRCALDWHQCRYARDHLGQPTEKMAAEALDKLFRACADLQNQHDGNWSDR